MVVDDVAVFAENLLQCLEDQQCIVHLDCGILALNINNNTNNTNLIQAVLIINHACL